MSCPLPQFISTSPRQRPHMPGNALNTATSKINYTAQRELVIRKSKQIFLQKHCKCTASAEIHYFCNTRYLTLADNKDHIRPFLNFSSSYKRLKFLKTGNEKNSALKKGNDLELQEFKCLEFRLILSMKVEY